MCGFGCLVFCVRRLAFVELGMGTWCLVFGILGSGVCCSEFWNLVSCLEFGVLGFEIWCLVFGVFGS